MKKALSGPAKRTAERRGIVAAARRRASAARSRALALSRRVDGAVNRVLVRAWPRVAAMGRGAQALGVAWGRRLGRVLRPVAAPALRLLRAGAVLLLRALGRIESALLRGAALGRRAARRARAAVTVRRAICVAILAAAGCLLVAQFLVYRAVEVGQPGYAGLPAASAPTVAARTAGQAHAYLLVPLALLAGALAVLALRNERRNGLGRVVVALGAIALAVVLLVDLPAGRDLGAYASRFSGARTVLYSPFYMELFASVGLMLGGILLLNAHRFPTGHGYRLRKPSLTRTQGSHRSARTTSA